MPKVVAVVGAKHSGKTTVIEHLTVELKRRGYRVGAIKEMVRISILDTPATETDRYTQAGAEIIVAIPRSETVVFVKKRLTAQEALVYLGSVDYALLEGFESEKALPKIVAAKTAQEAQEYIDSATIAISGIMAESQAGAAKASALNIPLLSSITHAASLADLVEKKAAQT